MSRAAPVAPRLTPQQVRNGIRGRVLDVEGELVVAVHLHGSRAKGTARPRSDWDVAVVVRGPVADWAGLQDAPPRHAGLYKALRGATVGAQPHAS